MSLPIKEEMKKLREGQRVILVHAKDLQDIEDFITRFADERKAPLSVNGQKWEAKRLMKRITAARYAYREEGGTADAARTVPTPE